MCVVNFRHTQKSMLGHAGFTLTEMVAVVALVGILASIALPSYRDHMVRGKIPDALTNLSSKRAQIEQYFQDNRTYVGAPACLVDTTTSQYFDFNCLFELQNTFTLQAVGKSQMAGFTYTINDAGLKQTTSVPAGWSYPAGNCWAIRKEGTC